MAIHFSKLYKKSSTGKLLSWYVWAEANTVFEEHGQVGGKLQCTPGTVCTGKQGRSDEEQATAEAKSRWEKKQKAGNYVLSAEAAMAGASSELVEGGLLPMLAHKFSEAGDKIKYPAFVQPKLDGHRCIEDPSDYSLWSRTRKRITGVPHIAEVLKIFQAGRLCWPLDGELYNHAYRNKFEELSSFIRSAVPKPGYEVVQYHVYDVVIPGHTFRERYAFLQETIPLFEQVHLVETREVANEDELMLAFEDFLAQGYEGAIARNADGLYVNKRSYDLLKIKQFMDSEFLCIGVEEGRGKMEGHAIFKCSIPGGGDFAAKMKGPQEELKKFFERPELVVGKQVTVKYQGMSKYGIPRFPVALRIRDDI